VSGPHQQHWLHGFLDLCLLSLLAERRDYGGGLTDRLAAAGFGDVPGGTLYPSLLRLEQHGLVTTDREPSPSGPPRKYYDLTDQGRGTLAERTADWNRFRARIDLLTVAGSAADRT
jgi:PadR family transcriptional regulator PadR